MCDLKGKLNAGSQVLPLSENVEPSGADDLFSLDDVKIEVMRARGAGGQVWL
jgi:peptide chain release factor 1